MKTYNPKDWFKLIFQFHKSDTVRMLAPAILGLAVYCYLIVYIETDVYHIKFKSTSIIHSLLGFVISLLLVFRTNTAYERWWEGRKHWGSLLNNSRNLAIKLNAYLPDTDHTSRKTFARLISDYAFLLKEHLRDIKVPNKAPVNIHQPNYIASALFKQAHGLYKSNKITGDELIVINAELQSFTDICGACERIKKTPIPYAYSIFLKKFIFVYIGTMPFSFVADFGYTIIPIVCFTFYAFASLELIAEEIEDPFGTDVNDLPTGQIAQSVLISVEELLLNQAPLA